MSIIKSSTPTKDGRQWQFRVSYKGHDGKHHTHASKLYKTKTEAKAEEAKYLAEDFRTNATAATIQDLYDGYLSLKEKEIKPQSVQKIKDIYQHIGPAIGSMRADKITVPEYEKFKQSIRDKGYSVCYCNKIHRLVKSILKYGQKYYGIVNTAPDIAGSFKAPRGEEKKMDFYTIDEYKTYREKLEAPLWTAFFDTLYYCGLRKGEANALTWHDIDLKVKTVTISKTCVTKIRGKPYVINSPKTNASNRTLPLTDQLIDDYKKLHSYYEEFAGFSDDWFVFGGIRPVSETKIESVNRKASDAAGLKHIRIHDFRHSCASLLINNGANITVVAEYLGHSNIEQTLNTYSHFYKSKLNEVVDLMNKL